MGSNKGRRTFKSSNDAPLQHAMLSERRHQGQDDIISVA